MLPQARRYFLRAMAGGGLAVVMFGGCGDKATPEAQVRAAIAAGEAAAEARDLGGLMEHVSPAFRDENGAGRDELKQDLRAYLVTHQSVRLLVRIETVEFPYRDLARVRLQVGTLGRETEGAAVLDLAADIKNVVLELQLEDDAWKVVRAAW